MTPESVKRSRHLPFQSNYITGYKDNSYAQCNIYTKFHMVVSHHTNRRYTVWSSNQKLIIPFQEKQIQYELGLGIETWCQYGTDAYMIIIYWTES